MKRVFSALLAVFLLLSVAGCGKTPPSAAETAPPAAESTPPVAEPAPAPEAPPAPTEAELAAQRVEELLASLTLEEKVGQLFFVRCPAANAVEDVSAYHLGGYILFGRDFKAADGSWLTRQQVVDTLAAYQAAAAADTGIPLLIGSDEEGGSVTRASHNPNLFDTKFRSPQWLRKNGRSFTEDAAERSNALLALGINVNLAPVADVSTDPADFIYHRTLGQDAQATADFVADTVAAMGGAGMGSVLKHFPGYGSNVDTHTGIALDTRSYSTFLREDLLPFRAGVAAGRTEGGQTAAVLVSHNIIQAMDPHLPASLSPAVHNVLRGELAFEGAVMTDDLAMSAVEAYAADGSVAVMAIAAGNDLLITGDYHTQIPLVIEAVESGILAEETVDTACRRVLTWKQTLGLIP